MRSIMLSISDAYMRMYTFMSSRIYCNLQNSDTCFVCTYLQLSTYLVCMALNECWIIERTLPYEKIYFFVFINYLSVIYICVYVCCWYAFWRTTQWIPLHDTVVVRGSACGNSETCIYHMHISIRRPVNAWLILLTESIINNNKRRGECCRENTDGQGHLGVTIKFSGTTRERGSSQRKRPAFVLVANTWKQSSKFSDP